MLMRCQVLLVMKSPGNEEPGVMLPGHYFTIEVSEVHGMDLLRLTRRLSPASFKERIQGVGISPMVGQRQLRSVLLVLHHWL